MPDALRDVDTNDFMDPHNLAQIADETMVVAEFTDSLRKKLEAIFGYSEKKYQIINTKKTKYYNFSAYPESNSICLNNNVIIPCVDADKGNKYLGRLFFPTLNIDILFHKNLDNRMHSIRRFYAWLEINEDTPVEMKLLVLDQCMFTSLLYGIETWGNSKSIEKRILKI